jgi:Fe-S cluster assembly ATP-binding protein
VTAALEIRDLRGGPGSQEILKGVSLTIEPGAVHAVMGPNGSGKSTLSHCLMGRPGYTVTAGEARVNGTSILGLPVYERARAGLFVGHQYPIEVPGVPNREFLAEVLVVAGHAGADIDALAASIDLPPELIDRSVNEGLSGGEKKRNELMQLAAMRPVVAVLDEIDSGLDVDALRSVATNVERMSSDGLAVLLITHYTRILGLLKADAVHVMLDGQILESGGPELADLLEVEGYERFRAGAGPASTAEDPFLTN